MRLKLLNESVNWHLSDDLVQVSRDAQRRGVLLLEALDAFRQNDGEESGGQKLDLLHDLVQFEERVEPDLDVGELNSEKVQLKNRNKFGADTIFFHSI